MGVKEAWPWGRWVWRKLNIPKHNFICWLTMHQRLMTKTRLCHLGISQDDRCRMCGMHEETTQHLFFECPFSKIFLHEILLWLGIHIQQIDIAGIWRRMARITKGKRCREVVLAIVATLVYWIWKARNKAVWEYKLPTTRYVIQQIKQEYRTRKIKFVTKNLSIRENEWIDRSSKNTERGR
ncbi:uncharacterized protein [Nicotiana sylvestris]|uniref:uncharacterized protein n=1 Tax=Nicotiana sylvestris TaxID=4096 RepID=UPI00388C70BB